LNSPTYDPRLGYYAGVFSPRMVFEAAVLVIPILRQYTGYGAMGEILNPTSLSGVVSAAAGNLYPMAAWLTVLALRRRLPGVFRGGRRVLTTKMAGLYWKEKMGELSKADFNEYRFHSVLHVDKREAITRGYWKLDEAISRGAIQPKGPSLALL
jgi:hypothetical protein